MLDPLHFDAHAADYVNARPPYPDELWRRVRETGLLEPGRSAVDLGAGSGEATGVLSDAGVDVIAVEPGPTLAALLKARHPRVDVRIARAEDLVLPEDSLDLAVAATSIHWMDLDVLLPRLYTALRPDGRLLVWRNVFGDATAPTTPFRERVQEIVLEREDPPRTGDPENGRALAERLDAGDLFHVDDYTEFHWSIELDEHQVRGLFRTFSDWPEGEVERVATAVRDLGGRVIEHYTSWLIVAAPAVV